MNVTSRILSVLCLLVLLSPSALPGQTLADYDYENLVFRGVGLAAGYIWPTTVEPTPIYSVRFDLGYLGPGVRIAPSIAFWNSELQEEELARLREQLDAPGEGGEVGWLDLSLHMDAHFVWATPIDLFTYLGAGVGIHALNGGGEPIAGTFVEDLMDSVGAGVAAIGGLEYEIVDRFRLYGELRYTLLSDLYHPGVRIGGSYMLPPGDRIEAEGLFP